MSAPFPGADISVADGHSLWRRAVGQNQPAPLSGCLGETRVLSSGLKVLVKYAFFPTLSTFWPMWLLSKAKRFHLTAQRFRAGIAGPAPFSMFWGKLEYRLERVKASLGARAEHCATPHTGYKLDLAPGVPPENLYPSMLRSGRALLSIRRVGSG